MRIAFLLFLLTFTRVFADDLPLKVIVGAPDQDWFPIAYQNDKGEYVGIWEDRIRELFANQLGVALEVNRLPWVRAQKEVERGNADVMFTIPTPERLKYSIAVPGKFFAIEFHLLLRKDHPDFARIAKLETLEDILKEDLTFVSTLGNGWYKANVANTGAKTEYVETDEQLIRFLLAKRADAMIDIPTSIQPIMEQYNAHDVLKFTPAVLSETPFSVLVSKKSVWAEHLDAIAEALKATDDVVPYQVH